MLFVFLRFPFDHVSTSTWRTEEGPRGLACVREDCNSRRVTPVGSCHRARAYSHTRTRASLETPPTGWARGSRRKKTVSQTFLSPLLCLTRRFVLCGHNDLSSLLCWGHVGRLAQVELRPVLEQEERANIRGVRKMQVRHHPLRVV